MEFRQAIKVADECWIALALLTREHPERESFSAGEIVDRIRREHLSDAFRPGIHAHLSQHNVCNREPSTARYRMFYRLGDGSLRLYRPGDECHPDRHGKASPSREEIPAKYHPLLDWYQKQYCGGTAPQVEEDPVLAMLGLGRDVWAGIDPDEYIRELRKGWTEESSRLWHPAPNSPGRHEQALWDRLVRYEGTEFMTKTHKPFTYKLDGDSGIWFYREGRRIERRVWRGELEAASKKMPLRTTTELSEFQCPAYLYGLLTDPRIISHQNR